MPRKEKRLPIGEAVSAINPDSISAGGRRRGAKRSPKKTRTTIAPFRFRSKRRIRPNCCLGHWNYRVRRRSNAARVVGRYCARAGKKRSAPREEPQERVAV